MLIPDSLQSVDFLIQLTGDQFNPTGIITPLSDAAFEMVHDTGMEFVSYDITDSNGFCFDRKTLDEIAEYIENSDLTFAMYSPDGGIAFLEPV